MLVSSMPLIKEGTVMSGDAALAVLRVAVGVISSASSWVPSSLVVEEMSMRSGSLVSTWLTTSAPETAPSFLLSMIADLVRSFQSTQRSKLQRSRGCLLDIFLTLVITVDSNLLTLSMLIV